jgi:hypothetical protein
MATEQPNESGELKEEYKSMKVYIKTEDICH